jgi:hypothetical protein
MSDYYENSPRKTRKKDTKKNLRNLRNLWFLFLFIVSGPGSHHEELR